MVVGGLFHRNIHGSYADATERGVFACRVSFSASLLIFDLEPTSFSHIRYDVMLRDDQALLRFISALRKVLFLQERFLWGMSPVLRQRTTFMEAKGCSSR